MRHKNTQILILDVNDILPVFSFLDLNISYVYYDILTYLHNLYLDNICCFMHALLTLRPCIGEMGETVEECHS
jgi:hypothetical protein